MMSKDEALKKYHKRFDEELSERYIANLTDAQIVDIVEECLSENLDYFQLQQKKYGDDILI